VRRIVGTSLKIMISVAIVGYLIWQARHDNAFAALRDQPKQWVMLVVAWFFCAGAVLTTIVRWHYLVRALEIPSRLSNSLRIGFVSYMFNLAPLGIVGGDAIKAVMLEFQETPTSVVVLADSPIQTLKDLEGKKIATQFDTAAHVLLVAGLKLAGVDTTKINFVNLSPAQWNTALIAGPVGSDQGHDLA